MPRPPRIRIIKHEFLPQCGSFEVKFFRLPAVAILLLGRIPAAGYAPRC